MKWNDIELPQEAVGKISASHSDCCRYCIKRRGQFNYVLFIDGIAVSSHGQHETLEQAKAEAERIKRIA